MDLLIFAGPVVYTKEMKELKFNNPTEVKLINGTGSSYFTNLAFQYKDSEGRILPNLVKKLTNKSIEDYENIYLAAWSAGWGLLNQITQNDQDNRDISALLLSDAMFGGPHQGFQKFAKTGKLMVITATNNSANLQQKIYKTGRESVVDLITSLGYPFVKIQNVEPMPNPSGGLYNYRNIYWFDYVKPGSPRNSGNDFTHLDHHHMAAKLWQAFLINRNGSNVFF